MTIIPGIFGGGTAIGSTGNVTFQRHPAGNLARAKVIPTNPNTTPQQEVRAVWTDIMTRWQTTLTNTMRDAWTDFALGAETRGRRRYPHFITGRQAFIRANTSIRRAGLPFVDNPPSTPGLAQTRIFTVTADSTDGVRITAISPALGANDLLQTQRSTVYQQTHNYFRGPYLETMFWTNADTLPFEIVPSVIVGFPERWFVRCTIVDTATGRLTMPQQFRADSFA